MLLSLAIMDEPNLLLLDEPVSGIDKNGMDLFYEKMDYLRNNYDMAIVLISHDLDYVAKYSDKVVLMDKTVLAEESPGGLLRVRPSDRCSATRPTVFPELPVGKTQNPPKGSAQIPVAAEETRPKGKQTMGHTRHPTGGKKGGDPS